jgi:protein-tyrosine phosphatase
MKVLMVCLGNICRSPLAEGILKHKIQAAGLDWTVDSAGIGGWHAGEQPDKRSIAIAKKYGIDITDQRARKIRATDLADFDLILAMDEENYNGILSHINNYEQTSKVHLIMNFAQPNKNMIVPDPYYDNRFQLVYDLLDEACTAIINKYKK